MSEAKEWYVWGDAPDGTVTLSLGDVSADVDGAVEDAARWIREFGGDDFASAQYIYRLVPVKIVRRAGVIVEDVS